MLAKLVCSVLVLSLASTVSAQTTAQKKPPVKEGAPAPVKAAPKPPPPAPEPVPAPPPPPPPTDVRIHSKLSYS